MAEPARPLTTADAPRRSPQRTADASPEKLERLADALLLTLIFFILAASYKTTEVLTVGDWNMWVDWKDREWWPLLYPLICITYPALVHGVLWTYTRLPFGATLAVLGLNLSTMGALVLGHVGWTNFPWSVVWGGTMLPGAIVLDCVLLLSGSWFATGIVGGALFAILFYPTNWPMLAPYRLVVEYMGQLATVADVIGFTFTRTSMPEYLRIIERGTLRTFGENPAIISALFSGFLCVVMYWAWYWLGVKIVRLPRIANDYRRYMGLAA
jgi:methane/ammonia monooxygenase subunit A